MLGSTRTRILLAIRAAIVVLVSTTAALIAPAAAHAAPPPQIYVEPYYVYPSDQPSHQEYVDAINALALEVQQWYRDHAGVTFKLKPLKIVRGGTYIDMRCGTPAPQECIDNRQDLRNWWGSMLSLTEGFKSFRSAWVFGQGGGGFAGANRLDNFAGFALLGDWVLEPISGVAEPQAIPCSFADWQCSGGAPKGAAAHELGHTFGLLHPDGYEGHSLMAWHGDYPDTSLNPWEIDILRNDLAMRPNAWRARDPYVSFFTSDVLYWGQTAYIGGTGFAVGDRVAFTDATHTVTAPAQVSNPYFLQVQVPSDLSGGYLRLVRKGNTRSNVVPVNFYPQP